MTRRSWIQRVTAAGLTACQWANARCVSPCSPPSVASPWQGFPASSTTFAPPVCNPNAVIRRKLFSESGSNLPEAVEAYQCWRALAADDPRGPNISMQVHGYFCSSQSPLGDIHCNWEFLPWHRAFIYFHERTLGKLVGNPAFRLPVWDWETSKQIPGFLKDAGCVYAPNPASSSIADNKDLLQWLTSSHFECFSGSAAARGNAFTGPHVEIHNYATRDFADLATAARLSIFYPHHANVDRYWMHWWNSYVNSGRKWPPSNGFASNKYQFYDECGNVVTVNPQDFLDPCRLGYTYTEPNLPLPLIKASGGPIEISAHGDGSGQFSKLPKAIDALDPAPVDATLDLRGTQVDLTRLNAIVLLADQTRIDAGRIGTLGHQGHAVSITWRIGFRRADLGALRGARRLVRIGLIPLNNSWLKPVAETFVPVGASLQFYELA